MMLSAIESFSMKEYGRKRMQSYQQASAGKVCNTRGHSYPSKIKILGTPTGIVDQYEQDQKLPTDQRYLWHLRMEGNIKLVVTMNPILAALFHTALYVVGDYTFKRVHGDLDECEFVVWNRATNEREPTMPFY